ncbi:Ig kappa chain V-V region HP R16.7 [Channa argus]|uniref:Ig kappa chain V-V region HP R16.7 n=1 Tax=Channa argus TaxID=215402 RepID=A0A6G1PVG9_CHAAH|nr:Ig kappa chain V-V region HP R16.7 [Channa argus]
MIGPLTALILLHTVSYTETAEDSHLISLTVVGIGDDVTFQCSGSESDSKFFYLNKQPVGHLFQTVVALVLNKVRVSEQFKNSRFTVTQEKTQLFVTIKNVTKEDEATYFCQKGGTFSQMSYNGTFLAVNGSVNVPHHRGHNKSTVHNLDRGDKAGNYAALDFPSRRVKKGMKKDLPQECVYSVVKADYHNASDHKQIH